MLSKVLLIFSLAVFTANYSSALPYHRGYGISHDRSDLSTPFGFRPGMKSPKRSFGTDPYNRKIDESFLLGNRADTKRHRFEDPHRQRNEYEIMNEARMGYNKDIGADMDPQSPSPTQTRPSRRNGSPQAEYGSELDLDYSNLNKYNRLPAHPPPIPPNFQRGRKTVVPGRRAQASHVDDLERYEPEGRAGLVGDYEE
ncbi:unnamed protein product [Orchesella dallaii]|uniref:Hymenoptaecin n=1 Tax=Orchesella dallaii TaxID=48710 RepID=A0ABP1Q4W5_9HEXA